MTMREDLAQWRDWDEAALSYGTAIGVFDHADERQATRVLLSNNPLGSGLHAGMLALVEAGVVERREEPDEQFRWIFTGTDAMPDGDRQGLGLQATPTHDTVTEPRRRWWQRG